MVATPFEPPEGFIQVTRQQDGAHLLLRAHLIAAVWENLASPAGGSVVLAPQVHEGGILLKESLREVVAKQEAALGGREPWRN